MYVGRKDDTNDSPQYNKVGDVVIKLVEFLPKYFGHNVYFDNLFTSIKLVRFLKGEGIWCVGTIRANQLEGASPKMITKKQLNKDYVVDANSNVVIGRRLDNGLVQLTKSFIGKED